MNIIVHDTLSTFEPLFRSTDNPKVLLEKARPVLFDPDGLQVQLGKHFANKEQNGFYVMQAAQRDGVHVLVMQQGWGSSIRRAIETFRLGSSSNLRRRMLLHASIKFSPRFANSFPIRCCRQRSTATFSPRTPQTNR